MSSPETVTPESLVFERATQDEQVTEHFNQNSQVQAAPLPLSVYMVIQHKLASTAASRGNTAYWVLRLPDNPEALISSCTTYMRDAIITTGQGTRNTKAVVITDIFTHPEYRMRGMAKMLLTKLRDQMDRDGFGNADFSVVYGDAHTGLLQGLGWQSPPVTQLRISLGQFKIEERKDVPGAEFLGYMEIPSLISKDVNTSKLRLSGYRDQKTHVQILPTDELLRWHQIRSRLYSQHMSRGKTALETHGARSHIGQPAWMWWVHDYRARKLRIVRIYVARLKGLEDGVRALLEAAVVEASLCGLHEVVIWQPREQVVQAAKQLSEAYGQGMSALQGERLEMMPCLRWRGGEGRDVVLEELEYYAWS
ncbi:hypothetical protein AK830_g12374 [Neonectria ditissima]|uniref:Uncharacterized protein n=1 Tax=Neonectria ditissima TaxID=78410 RepID=A0A0P7B3H6_9HYPO|nr:hypothetical protein AK830_g12374 [Neonectria ditissima]